MAHPVAQRLYRFSILSFLFATITLATPNAKAQAAPAAERNDAISAFANASRIYTDYGVHDYGYTLGADYTRYYHFVAPSLEARFTDSSGDAVTEKSFLTGLKAETKLRRLHPYADFLVGYGAIQFAKAPTAYTHDNSIVYDWGLGVDYALTSRFSIKADAQYQYWKLGSANHELEPYNLSLGVKYRIPSGWMRRRQ